MSNSNINFVCNKLSLSFKEKMLLHNLSFHFSGPGIIQIEGDNGTGKSSLLKVFAGFMNTNEGNVEFFLNEKWIKPENLKTSEFSFFATTSMGLLNDLTGFEHIELIAKAMKIPSVNTEAKIKEFEELEIFTEILSKTVADYSQGMKQLLRLFLHLFFSPKVVFLDEPFLYLSPKVKDFCLKKLEELSLSSLIFITDQKFTWDAGNHSKKISLGVM